MGENEEQLNDFAGSRKHLENLLQMGEENVEAVRDELKARAELQRAQARKIRAEAQTLEYKNRIMERSDPNLW